MIPSFTPLNTFTNDGPDAMPPGFVLDATITINVLEGEEASVNVVSSSSNVGATVHNSITHDDDGGTMTDVAKVTTTTTQIVAVNGTFVVTVLATYGALANNGVAEKVTVESSQTTTVATTCTTTVTTATVDGSSDGTSYTSAG